MPAQPRSLIGAHVRIAERHETPQSSLAAQAAAGVVSAGAQAVGGIASDGVAERTQYKTRKKVCKNEEHPDKLAAELEAAERGLEMTVEHFAVTRFPSSRAFDEALGEYAVANNVSLRTRDSRSAEVENKKRLAAYDSAMGDYEVAHAEWVVTGKKTDEPLKPKLKLVPDWIKNIKEMFRCTHGTFHKPRGKGKRFAAATRYTGCGARADLEAEYNESTDTWALVVKRENTVHNHAVNLTMFLAYLNSSMIDNAVLFNEVRGQVAMGGNGRLIRDSLSSILRRTYTSAQFNNLKSYRFGAAEAAENFQLMIDKFCSFEQNRCLMIEDEDDQVCGIVFQTEMQRKMFQLYGDSLILDWTHNTNNAGFHLGSLMVTSATGKGVPVLNFLCLSQGKEMMKVVLRFFVAENAGALEKIRSVVIDKDYTEWRAIEEIIPLATVVLCQFHVLKWLKQVIRDPKYSIDPTVQHAVMRIVRAMVYSETKEHFLSQRFELGALLSEHPEFHAYMKSRWYGCKKMWANYKRGQTVSTLVRKDRS